MKITALLPMKGHSERVPNKNMRDFCGKPLYHAVLESLLASEHISTVVVNTDSDRIKEDFQSGFGDRVVVHDRPAAIRGDFVAMNEIIGYDLELLPGGHFLQTHSTNPLLSTQSLDRAIAKYFEVIAGGYDSLFTVTRLQTRLYDSGGRPLNHDPAQLLRTQDLAPVFEENSCAYLFSRESFQLMKRRVGRFPFLLEIPREEAWDIDEELDFQVAEFLWKCRHDSLQAGSGSPAAGKEQA